jgi:antitoxin component of MazEF toxin-antitoxin module
MERKLVKQGRNALTLTLPAQWLKRQRLKAGDSVQVAEQNNTLTIATQMRATTSEITIDAAQLEHTMLYHALTGAYIHGYDRIIVTHGNFDQFQAAIRPRLLGFIVEEHTANRVVLKSIIAPSSENTHTLVRRAGHLLQQQAAIVLGISEGKATLEQLDMGEDTLDGTIFFCMRHLNTYEQSTESYRYFLLCATIEIAADQLAMVASHIQGHRDLALTMHKAISEYNKYLFANDFQKAYKTLRTWRNSIGSKQYIDGLLYAVAETLYNNLGYLVNQHQNI